MRLKFINRERELSRLSAFLGRKGRSLACLYGRRRCGKSRLIQQALIGKRAVYFVGDDRESPLQRRAVAREIARLMPGFDRVDYPGWDELLERWFTSAPSGAALIIDELPALVAAAPELPSLLQRHIDRPSKRSQPTILCGSSQRMMSGLLLDSTAPLYGRAQEILKLEPMQVSHLRDALSLRTSREAVESYAVWGGIPRYWELSLEHPNLSAAIAHLVLDPMGILHREPERLLLDDLRDTTQASSVLSLIASGCHRISEIGARLGRPATSLSRPLSRLIELGLVTREFPAGSSARDSKRSFYRVHDPFLQFWYRFVEPNRSRLEAGQLDLVQQDVMASWPEHLGQIWEQIARAAMAHLKVDGIRWQPGSRWWGKNTDGREIELDVVSLADSHPDRAFVGEVKLQCAPREIPAILAELKRKALTCPVLQGKKLACKLFVLKDSRQASSDGTIGPEAAVAALG